MFSAGVRGIKLAKNLLILCIMCGDILLFSKRHLIYNKKIYFWKIGQTVETVGYVPDILTYKNHFQWEFCLRTGILDFALPLILIFPLMASDFCISKGHMCSVCWPITSQQVPLIWARTALMNLRRKISLVPKRSNFILEVKNLILLKRELIYLMHN